MLRRVPWRRPLVGRLALYHGLTNTALVGSYVASFLRRREQKADDAALAHSALGAALVGLSGYLGGALVYEHGVRVGRTAAVYWGRPRGERSSAP